jgi:L,D-transpeptidase catalytic domain
MLVASRIALAATVQVLVWGDAVDESDARPELIVSVADQELAFVQHGNVVARYPVSTSKFGLGRCIYIHGTPEENRIGKPASFGCIRMRSNDVIALYERVHIGMDVLISGQKINELLRPDDERLFARSD